MWTAFSALAGLVLIYAVVLWYFTKGPGSKDDGHV